MYAFIQLIMQLIQLHVQCALKRKVIYSIMFGITWSFGTYDQPPPEQFSPPLGQISKSPPQQHRKLVSYGFPPQNDFFRGELSTSYTKEIATKRKFLSVGKVDTCVLKNLV